MNNIADKSGRYTGFTGIIKSKYSDCIVRNATFDILEKPKKYKSFFDIYIDFYDGTALKGTLSGANITGGTFEGTRSDYARIDNSVFNGGTVDGGYFHVSCWVKGVWLGGGWWCGYDKFMRMRTVPPPEWDNVIDQKFGTAAKIGRYENFSGEINWEDTKLKVRNATFELDEHHEYTFKKEWF